MNNPSPYEQELADLRQTKRLNDLKNISDEAVNKRIEYLEKHHKKMQEKREQEKLQNEKIKNIESEMAEFSYKKKYNELKLERELYFKNAPNFRDRALEEDFNKLARLMNVIDERVRSCALGNISFPSDIESEIKNFMEACGNLIGKYKRNLSTMLIPKNNSEEDLHEEPYAHGNIKVEEIETIPTPPRALFISNNYSVIRQNNESSLLNYLSNFNVGSVLRYFCMGNFSSEPMSRRRILAIEEHEPVEGSEEQISNAPNNR